MHAADAGGVTGGVECGDRGMIDVDAGGTGRKKIVIFGNVGVGVELLENEARDEEGQGQDVDMCREVVYPARIVRLCTGWWIWMGNA